MTDQDVRAPHLEGTDLVTPVAFGSHVHWYKFKHNPDGSVAKKVVNGKFMPIVLEGMKVCSICLKEDEVWNAAIDRRGSEAVAIQITKRESFRLYDRKYPYDIASKAVPLDAIQDTLGYENDHEARISGNEATAAFLAALTPMQRFVAEQLNKGYRPREIAAMLGREDSGSVRFHKHMVKAKAKEWFGL